MRIGVDARMRKDEEIWRIEFHQLNFVASCVWVSLESGRNSQAGFFFLFSSQMMYIIFIINYNIRLVFPVLIFRSHDSGTYSLAIRKPFVIWFLFLSVGGLTCLILIKMHLYYCGCVRGKSEIMNLWIFNMENPPSDGCTAATRQGWMWAYCSGACWFMSSLHQGGLSSSNTTGFCVFIKPIWAALQREEGGGAPGSEQKTAVRSESLWKLTLHFTCRACFKTAPIIILTAGVFYIAQFLIWPTHKSSGQKCLRNVSEISAKKVCSLVRVRNLDYQTFQVNFGFFFNQKLLLGCST